MRKAFTLIELLVVIAIIAILAAILFPVFAQAKLQAKKTSDLSNLKELSTATLIYTNDSDDVLFTPVDPCTVSGTNTLQICSQYSTNSAGLDGTSGEYLYWTYKLQPYSKNFQIFKSPVTTAFTSDSTNGAVTYSQGIPEASGRDWGGQDSYAYNGFFLSPINGTNTLGLTYSPVPTTASPRVSTTLIYTDATFHLAAPDVKNLSGYTVTNHLINTSGTYELNQMTGTGVISYPVNYWENLGGNFYTSAANGTTAAQAVVNGPSTFGGKLNASYLDGHAKSLAYQQIVGDICYWSIDQEGAHPNCS